MANFLFWEWKLSRVLVDWIRRRSSRNQRTLGYLLHYLSHVDGRYKQSLLKTMLNRAFIFYPLGNSSIRNMSGSKRPFSTLRYPYSVEQSTIRQFIDARVSESPSAEQQAGTILREKIQNRFVMQRSERSELSEKTSDLSRKINADIRPVYTSRKIKYGINMEEETPPIVN